MYLFYLFRLPLFVKKFRLLWCYLAAGQKLIVRGAIAKKLDGVGPIYNRPSTD